MSDFFVHPNALCETEDVGAHTRIWAFAHVLKGARIGRNCNIGDHAFIEGGASLGDGVTVKNNVLIWEGVQIEDGVFVGPAAIFTNDRFPRSPRCGIDEVTVRYGSKDKWLAKTHVLKGASIGAGAVVCPGLRIGSFATIAAGAVVTKDVKNHALIMGNPGRQAGWVCHCGLKLSELSGTLSCESCQTRFQEAEDGLVEMSVDANKD